MALTITLRARDMCAICAYSLHIDNHDAHNRGRGFYIMEKLVLDRLVPGSCS